MSRKSRELRDNVKLWLGELGVAEPYVFSFTGGGHQRVCFEVCGRGRSYVFPSTQSDARSTLNTRADIRRLVRAAQGSPVPAVPTERPVLDARRVLPRQPHYVGGRGKGSRPDPQTVAYASAAGQGSVVLITARP